MDKYNSKQFVSKINEKINQVPLKCPFCGSTKFTAPSEYANITISNAIGNVQIGPTIPAGIVVCENCGHIDFFALGVLGLLNKPGENNDGN